jgi:hypothetical protein
MQLIRHRLFQVTPETKQPWCCSWCCQTASRLSTCPSLQNNRFTVFPRRMKKQMWQHNMEMLLPGHAIQLPATAFLLKQNHPSKRSLRSRLDQVVGGAPGDELGCDHICCMGCIPCWGIYGISGGRTCWAYMEGSMGIPGLPTIMAPELIMLACCCCIFGGTPCWGCPVAT